VSPLLKKPSLDPSCRDVQLYRPVSNLTFVSKVVERVVASQLTRYLQSHDLMPRMQSAYRKYHTTETALLRVLSDIYAAVDERRVTLLALLDLSAAFYCGTTTYSCRAPSSTGVRDRRFGVSVALIFLSGRTHRIFYLGQLSEVSNLLFGVPQGSVLGRLLFLLYVAELAEVIAAHSFTDGHFYADDSQMYISVPVPAADAARCLSACIVSVESWMSSHCLKMNPDKSQLLWIGTRPLLSKVTVNDVAFSTGSLGFSSVVSNLGVLFDVQLSTADHVTSVCKSCFFQLRQLRLIRSCLTTDAAKTLIHVFVSSRLDYCNSLLVGVAD